MNNTALTPKTRIRSMLKLDFYRLFHTPAFYIMLMVAAMIPALLLTMSGMDPVTTGASGLHTVSAVSAVSAAPAAPAIEYTNAWQVVESTGGSAVAENPLDFSGFANINMLYIFAGLLMALFVSHDYRSGFVKHIFTVHAKKSDYVVSKTAIGVFSGAGMILTYVLGTIIAGLITGKSFDVNVGGLILCLLSKTFLMGIFCSLFLGVAVFFRDKLWLTIVFTFLLGMMLYPAASIATLGAGFVTLLLSLVGGAIGAAAIGVGSSFILNKRDLV